MITTTWARYLAVGGFGLAWAYAAPSTPVQAGEQASGAIVIAQAGNGDEPNPRARQQNDDGGKPNRENQKGRQQAREEKRDEARERKQQAREEKRDEARERKQAREEKRDEARERKQQAREEKRDEARERKQQAREEKRGDARERNQQERERDSEKAQREQDRNREKAQREQAERERDRERAQRDREQDREKAQREQERNREQVERERDRERAQREREKERDNAQRERERNREQADRERDRERAQRENEKDRDRAQREQERNREQAERERDRERAQRERERDRAGRQEDRAERRESEQERRERRREVREERRGNIAEIRRERRERRENGRLIIEEPGNRQIIREGNRTIIRHDDSDRFRRRAENVEVERRNGNRVTTITRPNGNRIVTVEDSDGRLLRRIRRTRDGREIVLIDNTRHYHDRDRRDYRDDRRDHRHHDHRGDGLTFFLDLAMPQVHIDRHHYIVDAGDASEDYLYETLVAPPVVEIERDYSLDEIRYNYPLRARMRSVNLNTINFEFGSWEVDDQAYDQLGEVARAIKRALDRNPDEIFLIEGHTDAVGSDEDNLTLADRRAETVAIILSDEFNVPPENLTTQGYGEQYLLVETQEPERQNRRVTIRRITPLLSGGPRETGRR